MLKVDIDQKLSTLKTINEGATYLRVGESTFRRMLRSGMIPWIRINKRKIVVQVKDLDDYLQNQLKLCQNKSTI